MPQTIYKESYIWMLPAFKSLLLGANNAQFMNVGGQQMTESSANLFQLFQKMIYFGYLKSFLNGEMAKFIID